MRPATPSSAAAPRRPLALFWPLLGLAGIALATALVGLGARYVLPLSATAHLLLHASNVFVIIPALAFGVPGLLITQGFLLARSWRQHPRSPVA